MLGSGTILTLFYPGNRGPGMELEDYGRRGKDQALALKLIVHMVMRLRVA